MIICLLILSLFILEILQGLLDLREKDNLTPNSLTEAPRIYNGYLTVVGRIGNSYYFKDFAKIFCIQCMYLWLQQKYAPSILINFMSLSFDIHEKTPHLKETRISCILLNISKSSPILRPNHKIRGRKINYSLSLVNLF